MRHVTPKKKKNHNQLPMTTYEHRSRESCRIHVLLHIRVNLVGAMKNDMARQVRSLYTKKRHCQEVSRNDR